LLLKAGRNPLDISSIIVCYPSGKAKSNSDAVIAIADQLQGVLPMLASSGRILPSPIRDTIYGFISKHRKKIYIGEYDSCRLDFDGEFESRFVTEPDV
jgi:predicted DCC family thiol-disulfide oxidoreductase YuxK